MGQVGRAGAKTEIRRPKAEGRPRSEIRKLRGASVVAGHEGADLAFGFRCGWIYLCVRGIEPVGAVG